MKTAISALVAFLAIAASNTMAADGAAAGGVKFDAKTRTFSWQDRNGDVLLDRGMVWAQVGDRNVFSDDRNLIYTQTYTSGAAELRLEFAGAFTLHFTAGETFQVRIEGEFVGSATLQVRAPIASRDALIAMLDDQRKDDQGVLVTRLGPADIARARSLFVPKSDLALTLDSAGGARWQQSKNGWGIESSAPAGKPLLRVSLRRNYYRDALKIAHYAPIAKRSRWQTAPVVAMTWYGIEGWKGNPAQTKEWLNPNIDWVAKHLLPYAETLVFQLDDNYYTDNDKYMREISDYIRSKGLIPGIWFTPYTVAPKEVADKHPDWFIHDKDGKLIGTFGGVSYKDRLTLNVTKPDAAKEWFGMWWRKASETWNFDFFKIDGQPDVIGAYRKAMDGGGVEGYRKGLAIGREIVGPEKFINGCWGIPLEAAGLLDGSRTGGDTGNQAHAIDVILKWNFLNDVVWWSDPDAAANLYKATVERARLNAQARVLTGQQFLTDDVWTSVPEAIRRVWQLSYPTLDVRPVNLYPIDDWRKYDLFDLKVGKPWGIWDVVGLFNYDGQPREKVLDLSRLPLDADEVHVFDYWNSVYLGRFRRDAKIHRALAAHEGELFSIAPAPADGRPVLVSTSRHLSQGGLDLDEVGAKRSFAHVQSVDTPDYLAHIWILRGKSSHVIAGDPYELVFATGNYDRTTSFSFAGSGRIPSTGGLFRLRIIPEKSGTVEWTVPFEEILAPRLDVAPPVCNLRPGMTAEIGVVNLGQGGFTWEARASDSRIRVLPPGGKLSGWPQQARLAVSADPSGLEPGSIWRGNVVIEAKGIEGSPRQVQVRLQVPPPENLALRAKAKASSIWSPDYKAECVNDGETATRWNSARTEKSGCWIELDWEKPVTFDRVVIDEVIEFGGRIEAWKLEAGFEKADEIARGTSMGHPRTISLPKAVEAKRLRLTIEKAKETPTLREIEVYRWAKAN